MNINFVSIQWMNCVVCKLHLNHTFKNACVLLDGSKGKNIGEMVLRFVSSLTRLCIGSLYSDSCILCPPLHRIYHKLVEKHLVRGSSDGPRVNDTSYSGWVEKAAFKPWIIAYLFLYSLYTYSADWWVEGLCLCCWKWRIHIKQWFSTPEF